MSGIYIHIPFCASRCIYCGFYSTTNAELERDYVSAICRESELRHGYIDGPFETVYLGGGTPSQLPLVELHRLFDFLYKMYDISPNAEITVECNPDDVNSELIRTLRAFGVNRVSMGVQTFSDERLKFLHRRHNAGEVRLAIEILRNFGIENISIDLIFGFPGETLAEWNRDIDCALKLNVEHISAYSLMYEEGTALYQMLESGRIREVDETVSLQMYERLIDRLESAGYEHYEISNFARLGYRSRHNSSYWQCVPYIGLGAAAHSYDLVSRQWNVSNIKEYIRSINNGRVPYEREELNMSTRYDDLITTAMRTSDGVSLNYIESVFGHSYVNYCMSQARTFLDDGLLELTSDNNLKLSRKGLFVSDMIMSELMKVN